jgi:hypothetical protein
MEFCFTYLALVPEMEKLLEITGARIRKTISNTRDVRPSDPDMTLWSCPKFDGKLCHAMLMNLPGSDWTPWIKDYYCQCTQFWVCVCTSSTTFVRLVAPFRRKYMNAFGGFFDDIARAYTRRVRRVETQKCGSEG